ncbi:hypothetical protein [Pontimicrobium sp. SW4]|uniref:Uncharacterized protein n=1 Tax=Pontimicrobium sp. SW4 TaxID=3153519 RepID=A0AAU7BRY4_9FLAO
MKAFTYILSVIALGLIIFNLAQIDYNDPFDDKNTVALITVMTGLCTILLLAILRVSKKIEAKVKKRR